MTAARAEKRVMPRAVQGSCPWATARLVTTPAPRQATASWPVISPRGLGVGVTHLVHLAGSYRRWRARNTAAGGVVTGCSGTSWFCYIGPAALRPGERRAGLGDAVGGVLGDLARDRRGWQHRHRRTPQKESRAVVVEGAGAGAASVVRPGSTPSRCWDGISGECPHPADAPGGAGSDAGWGPGPHRLRPEAEMRAGPGRWRPTGAGPPAAPGR